MYYYNIQPYNQRKREERIPIRHHMEERLMGWAIPPIALRFPRLAYNRQPYNHPARTEENIIVRAAMTERLTGWLKIGADYTVSNRMTEQLAGRLRLAAGQKIVEDLEETLSGSAYGVTGYQIKDAFVESLEGALHLGADITMQPAHLKERLEGALHLGANIYTGFAAREELSGLVHMGADIYCAPAFYEVLNGYANVRNIAESITIITDPIPAGAVLVIDADRYTMTLQDKNGKRSDVIHWQQGDWLWVGRGTIALTLSGIGSNSYSWEVFYHALYL